MALFLNGVLYEWCSFLNGVLYTRCFLWAAPFLNGALFIGAHEDSKDFRTCLLYSIHGSEKKDDYYA